MKKALLIFCLSIPYIVLAQQKRGLALVDSFRYELSKVKEDTNKASLLAYLSFAYHVINPDTGIIYGQEGVTLSEKIHWEKGVALNSNSIGVNYEDKSDYRKALQFYQNALKINQKRHDQKGIAHNLGNIGLVYESQSNYPWALDLYLQALAINEALGNKHEIANNYGNIGNIYLRQNDFKTGLEYYSKALQISKELKDSSAIADNMGVIGAIYLAQDNCPPALEIFTKVLRMEEGLGNKSGIAYNLENISTVYCKQKNYPQALEYAFKALAIDEKLGSKRNIANIFNDIGTCYYEIAQDKGAPGRVHLSKNACLRKSAGYLGQAVSIFRAIGDLDQLQEASKNLSKTERSAGNYKAALESELNSELIKDSVFSIQSKVELANLASLREIDISKDAQIEKKEDEIAKLQESGHLKERIISTGGICLLLIIIAILMETYTAERKNAKEKLEGKENKYRALVENSSDVKIIISPEGKTQYVSPSAKKVLGYTDDEVMQAGLLSLIHPDGILYFQKALEEAFSNPQTPLKGYTMQMRHNSGAWMWIEATLSNMLATPSIQGIVINFHDITENTLANEKLCNANRLYAFISAINQTIVHISNEQDLFKEACRIATELGQFKATWIWQLNTPDNTLHLMDHSGLSPEDAARFTTIPYEDKGPTDYVLKTGNYYICNDIPNEFSLDNWKTFAEAREFRSCMVLPIKKSGKIIGTYNLYSSKLNYFNDDEIALLLEAAGDISFALDVFQKDSEKNEMKNKLAHSDFRLRQAQEIAHFGSWELSFSTGIAFWSEEACRIYGLAIEDNEQTYQNWLSFIHPDDVEDVIKITKEGQNTLTNTAFFHRIIRNDGTIRHIYSKAEFDFNNGIPVGLYGVAHDITDIKESEAERTKVIADIMQRNKDLEQFSYIVSHNLRAPIANIIGLSELLRVAELNEHEETVMIEGLGTSIKKLDDVIKDLNYVLQVKHQVNEKREMIDLSELIGDIKLSIANLLVHEHVRIISDFSEVNKILTLKSYFYSILFNLISNSIKYRKANTPPLIEIKSFQENNKITIVFTDNGLGIDLAQKGEQVFGLYKRFHDHTEGKGMGLYMVKTQVETLGGKIAIASEVNKGTTFKITFENN